MANRGEAFSVAVIGGGPGGYAAAFHAADLGLKVALINDEDRLGGVCLLRGCIPSKAMITAAETYDQVRQAEQMGIVASGVKVDFARLAAWRDRVVAELAQGVEALCRGRGIDRVTGRARFKTAKSLEIERPDGTVTEHAFDHAIIATGSRPVLPRPFERHERVITSDEALSLTQQPRRLLVVGGGYIGIELGSCFASLGSDVTIVEMLDHLLPGTDRDLVRVVQKSLQNRGVRIHLKSKVTAVQPGPKQVDVTVQPESGETWTAAYDLVLVAVGRRPNTDNLGLDRLGLGVDEAGHVAVDERCATTQAGIYAIGDCTGQPYLAHRARRQGMVVAEVIAGRPAAFDPRTIPAVIFSHPEIAYCGLSEEEAKRAGYSVRIGRFRFAASGRAKTLHQTDGHVTIVAEEGTEAILGVRMVGPNVSELLGEATLAVETGAVVEDLVGTIHAHPTLSEAVAEAAEAVRGHAIHTVRARPRPTRTA